MPYSSGGSKSNVVGFEGKTWSRPFSLACKDGCLLSMSLHIIFPLHVCLETSSFHKDIILIGLGPTLDDLVEAWLSLYRCYLQIRSHSEILRLGLGHMNFRIQQFNPYQFVKCLYLKTFFSYCVRNAFSWKYLNILNDANVMKRVPGNLEKN